MEKLEKYYNQIKNSPVFLGMSDDELKGLLECFGARIRKFEKEEMIIRQGDVISNIYLILDGEVNIEKDSYWGRRIIISRLGKNDILRYLLLVQRMLNQVSMRLRLRILQY